MQSAFRFIIRTCLLEKHLKGPPIIPKCLTRVPEAFLHFLQIEDMVKKKALIPEIMTTERILDSFYAGFRKRPDFLVLHFMFLDFVENLSAPNRETFNGEIAKIDGLIETKIEASDAYVKQGIAHQNKGHYDQAISNYTKAIKLNPQNSDALYNQELSYGRGKGQFGLAISDFTKVIEPKPDDVGAFYNRAVSYFQKGEYQNAFNDVKKV